MTLRRPLFVVFLPMSFAFAGCGGTVEESYSNELIVADDESPEKTSDQTKSTLARHHGTTDSIPESPVALSGSMSDNFIYPPDQCDGCGGGGGGTTTAPTVDTSASYLNTSARSYLTQTGVTSSQEVGGTKWVNACKVSAYQGAVTFNSGVTRTCSWANVNPGWIILEVTYDVLRNDHGRGSASVSSTNGPTTINVTEFGSKFKLASEVALGLGDFTAKGKLDLEYQRLNGYSFYFGGTGNQLVAQVTANGGAFRSSSIEIQAKAKLLRIY